jgi:hypothetical protein
MYPGSKPAKWLAAAALSLHLKAKAIATLEEPCVLHPVLGFS